MVSSRMSNQAVTRQRYGCNCAMVGTFIRVPSLMSVGQPTYKIAIAANRPALADSRQFFACWDTLAIVEGEIECLSTTPSPTATTPAKSVSPSVQLRVAIRRLSDTAVFEWSWVYHTGRRYIQ